ncbi:GGDEF domain-containing protein [Thalassotalea ganghwensis]
MQTLNIIEKTRIDFNAFTLLNREDELAASQQLTLAKKLQTSLELDTILNSFAAEAANLVNFSGLFFKQGNITAKARGSRNTKKERIFELKLDGVYLGSLTYALNRPISIVNRKKLEQLHQLLLYPLYNAIQYQNAIKLAMEDGLTGLGNRRQFDQQLKRAMHHANRQQSRLGIIVGDLNKFKQINDTYGHQIGDEVLIAFADALVQSTRDSDSVFRFGGDEFAVIVENACDQSLQLIEQRIDHTIKRNATLSKYQVTCSLGYTFMTRVDTEESLFERADNMLYRRKMNMPVKLSVV